MNTPRSAAQLAAEEIRQISDTTRHKDYMAQVTAIIEKHFPPQQPLPVSGETPTPRTDAIYDTPRGDRNWWDVVQTHRELARQLEHELVELQNTINTLHNLMTTAEQRGIDKVKAELATERAARERDIPTITGRTKNIAKERLGEVLRHSDGPNLASHGCVEVQRAYSELEYWIARAEAAEHRAEKAEIQLAQTDQIYLERLDAFEQVTKRAEAAESKSGDVAKLRTALEFYANPNDWDQGIASGSIAGAKDGEPFMAFSKGEDHPWSIAQAALASVPAEMPKIACGSRDLNTRTTGHIV